MQGKKQDFIEHDLRNNKVKEGFLFQRSRMLKDWKKRWMVLTKNCLYSFEHQGVYHHPTQKITLKDISTIKSFYKNQYDKGQVFRVESDDTYFYLSGNEHQQKWAWVTAIEKTTEVIRNPALKDTQSLIRQSIRMSAASRQSASNPLRQSNYKSQKKEERVDNLMKLLNMKMQSHTNEVQYIPISFHYKSKPITSKLPHISIPPEKMQTKHASSEPNLPEPQKWLEKIVEVEVPVERIVERKIEIEKVVYVHEQAPAQSCNLIELFSSLISSKLEDPRPILDFVAFLTLTGIEKYQNAALEFCCQENAQRFFAELLLQAVNEEISEERLNNYMGFVYIICEREPDYFYASDMKILVDIILRQLELCRSDLNHMINLRVLKVLLSYHLNILENKVDDIYPIVQEIARIGISENQGLAEDVMNLIS